MGRCIGCFQTNEDDVNVCPFCGYSTEKKIEGYYLKPGTELYSGRYIVGNVLGRGGFGITYLAWDNIAEKKVSIKEYFPSSFSSRNEGKTELSVYSGSDEECFKEGLIRFIDEAQRLAKLVYIEGIIQINECFEENNTAYIVMEYLDGESLSQKLDREGKIAPDMAINLLIPIMQSLIKVHKEGIIHRDISPDNIFILKDGTAKLLDFGSARQAIAERSSSMTVIVKEGYSPEEQYSTHGEQGTWTDVYSMGATLFRMITGEKLLAAVERRSRLVKNKKDSSSDLSTYGIKVDDKISTAINNALKLDTNFRTQTMESLIEELQLDSNSKKNVTLLTKDDSLELKDDRECKRYKLPVWLIIGGILIVIALILIIIHFSRNSTASLQNETPNKTNTPLENDINDKDNVDSTALQSKEYTMIDFKGMSYEQTSLLLQENGIECEIYYYEINLEMEENIIISQSVEAGVVIQTGTAVSFVVSCKSKNIEMPDVLELDESDAKSKLEALGLKVQIIHVASKGKTDGKVVSQTPSANIMVATGCISVIRVCDNSISTNGSIEDKTQTQKHSSTQKSNVDNTSTDGTNIVNNTGSSTHESQNSSTSNSQNSSSGSNSSSGDTDNSVVTTQAPVSSRNETPASSFKYSIINKQYIAIDGYIGSDKDVVVPEYIEGYPVKKISDEAFKGNNVVVNLDLPDTITILGQWFICDCPYLSKCNIPKKLEIIGENAFYSPRGYSFETDEIYLPKSVVSIGQSAFSGRSSYSKLVLDISTDIPAYCFALNWYTMTSVEIGNGVTKIGEKAFFMAKFPKLILSNSVKSIGASVFYCQEPIQELTVYYRGTEEQYKTLLQSVSTEGNDRFINAKVVYNYKY